MSKIESGNVGLSEDAFCLEELVEEVSLIVKPDMDSKGQELSISLKEIDHHAVYGDAVRVKQILINLLSNAVKYTSDRGHIAVSLEEKLSSESGVGCFEFVVEDDGIGMAPEFLEKLFMPFERAEDSRVSQVQGTGLGLAITRNLVQMMNGTIRVESQLNRGTRFHCHHISETCRGGRYRRTVPERKYPQDPGFISARNMCAACRGQ